ncbi:MAG: hypothetical protein M0Z82_02885 [Actinomycetota bacterium]|jgi:hypothetical protein|nr:hypothetical protein [Actinomycetota bacterium]
MHPVRAGGRPGELPLPKFHVAQTPDLVENVQWEVVDATVSGRSAPARFEDVPATARLEGGEVPVHHVSERATVRRQTDELLTALGDTPAQVAASLAGAGVRGVPSNSRDCAVAVYLGAVVAADDRVRGVKVCKSEVLVERTGWWRRSVVVALPTAVRELIAAFDARSYPQLLRPDVASATGRLSPATTSTTLPSPG